MDELRTQWSELTPVFIGDKTFGNRFPTYLFNNPKCSMYREKQLENHSLFQTEYKSIKHHPQMHFFVANSSRVINDGGLVHTNILYIYKDDKNQKQCNFFQIHLIS